MSEKFPAATREDHDAFCDFEGWLLRRGAKGKLVTHHRTYTLALWNGNVLRTRISKPIDGSTYGVDTWKHILREQLEVTEPVFWKCSRRKERPDRGEPSAKVPEKSVPLYLLRELTKRGQPEADVTGLSAAEAAELLAKLLAAESEA